ncbi:MAG: hypothetical protein IJ371_06760 [Clostridia bacterium]|nr:hypothetical protein [Clostridia bacterium]
MFKGSWFKLILGGLILLFSYVIPVFMIPIGSYTYSKDNSSLSYSFKLNGKFENEVGVGDNSVTLSAYYKIEDGIIYISDDKNVEVSEITKLAEIENIYTLKIGDKEFKNHWALGFTIIGFVLTGWGFLGLFSSKKKD